MKNKIILTAFLCVALFFSAFLLIWSYGGVMEKSKGNTEAQRVMETVGEAETDE